MINLSSIDIAKKNLVVRVDMNVPIKDGHILDATRIEILNEAIRIIVNNPFFGTGAASFPIIYEYARFSLQRYFKCFKRYFKRNRYFWNVYLYS